MPGIFGAILADIDRARRHAAAEKLAWISRNKSSAARAFGVLTGTSMLMVPVPSRIQVCARYITSAR